jgi:four helix bundle protein
MSFQAFDIALDLVRSLREPLARVATRDADLEKQLRRAASSVALNLGEARRRFGRDRNHLFRVAGGSAGEVAASLRVAEAWGYLQPQETADSLALCDRLLAITWKLTR